MAFPVRSIQQLNHWKSVCQKFSGENGTELGKFFERCVHYSESVNTFLKTSKQFEKNLKTD